MRIAMLADFPATPSQILGGVQAVTVYLARALAKLEDVDLHVIATDPSTASDHEDRIGRITVHRLGTRSALKSAPKLLAVDVPRLVRRARLLQPDVVHGQGADIYGYAALRTGLPSVVTLHGMLKEDARYWTTRRERLRGRIAAWLFERQCIRRAAHVISISPYVSDYWGGQLRAEIYPIENPVDEAFFKLPADGARAGSVLYAGVIAPRKRLHDLIEAVRQVRGARLPVTLRIAGKAIDPVYAAQLQRTVEAQGLGDVVTFLGTLNEAQVLEEFTRGSMLALPSAQETAPMVIEQAMAAARPVVATRVGGVGHLVAPGETGLLVEPGDPAGLAAALARLVGQPATVAKLGAAARSQARTRFHADAVARQTRDAYGLVLRAARRSTLRRGLPASEAHRVG